MAQALLFINGDLLNRKVTADDGLVDRLIKAGKSDPEILDQLYWTTCGRGPRADERSSNLNAMHRALETASAAVTPAPLPKASTPDPKAQQALHDAARRRAFEDMLWVLVNSKEFLFNH